MDRVNITIWNGTIIENRHRKYSAVVKRFFTRLIYHAHMEVHRMITPTDSTVIKREVKNASIKPVLWIPLI